MHAFIPMEHFTSISRRSISCRAATLVDSVVTEDSREVHGRIGCVRESSAAALMDQIKAANPTRLSLVSITLTELECLAVAKDQHLNAKINA